MQGRCPDRKPKDLDASRKCFGEEKVVRCNDLISEWNNPFKERKELMSLSSGLIPIEKAKEDILKAYKIRKLDFERFVEERICAHTVSFYDPINRTSLKHSIRGKRVKKKQPKRLL